ncbi:MAG TPA: DUF1552 domain-containing protein [Polyangiaceae bacterium]
MIHSKNRITRRTLLRGTGGVAVGLPFLSAMLTPRTTHAQATTATRFIVFFNPGGTLLDKWRPTGTSASFTLQKMLSPLAPYQDQMTLIDGVDLKIGNIGAAGPHARGMAGILTGQQLLPGKFDTNAGLAGFADGPSIDQVIAAKISAGLKFKSLEFSAGWSTGIAAGGMPHPSNQLTYAGSNMPIPPATDPANTWKRLFSDVGQTGQQQQAQLTWNRSILDSVSSQYKALSSKLGAEDRMKLDAHLAMIQDAQARLGAAVSGTCAAPTDVNQTPGYYEDGDSGGGIFKGVMVPAKGDVMQEMLVIALACGLTNVATMQWSDSEAKFLLTFLKNTDGSVLQDNHHGYQHDGGFQPGALEVIYNWYAQKLASLLARMKAITEGNGKTLLDNSVILYITELQKPDTHDQHNIPIVLIGGGGGVLKGNRWIQIGSAPASAGAPRSGAKPHNNVLVSILNLFGFPQTTFGHPMYCTGPIAGLV